jgi:hypothetical protein
LRSHFSDAWIFDYESLIPEMTNAEKDRHVSAAAVCAEAPIIVTFNLRHFGPEHMEPWGILAVHPQSFLIELFYRQQELVLAKLERQAADRSRSLPQLLKILTAVVPDFAAVVSEAL